MAKIKHKVNKNLKAPRQLFRLSVYYLVIVVCFVIPLVHSEKTINPVFYPRLAALGTSVFILAVLMFFESRKVIINNIFLKNGFFNAFLFFILISITSLFIAVNPIEGLSDLFKWILIFMLSVLATILMIYSKHFFQILLKGIIINAFLFFVIGIIQYLENAFQNPDPKALYEVIGLMGIKNQFSVYLYILLPFLFSGIVNLNKPWKRLAIFASILVLLLILILQTRSVWMALFISGLISSIIFLITNFNKGIIILKNINHKRILFSGIFLISLFIITTVFFPFGPLRSINERINTIFNPEFTSNVWRVQMWDATTQLIKDQPLTGVGAGNWKISIYTYYGEYLPSVYRHWRNPHNDYLLTFAEKGIAGLLGFISIFVFLLYYALRNLLRARDSKSLLINLFLFFGITGYMIISFFSFPNQQIIHLVFIALASAFILSEFLKAKTPGNITDTGKAWFFLPVLAISYLAIHFGFIAINSEININKVHTAQTRHDWKAMKYFADKAYSKFAPIEPKYSYPVHLYSGLASFSVSDYILSRLYNLYII
jgi:O-antigen ligase